MALARTNIIEDDRSGYIQAFQGVYGALCVPNAERGPLEPVLISNEAEYLSVFTVDHRIPVGSHVANFDSLIYLNHSDKLWVRRVMHNDATYASLIFNQAAAAADHGYHQNTPVLAPVVAAATATGGTLAAGTYYYVVTSVNELGESQGSVEASVTLAGGNNAVALTWSAVTGAATYRIYGRSLTNGELLMAEVATTGYTDTGVDQPVAGRTVPTVNSTTFLTNPEGYTFGTDDLFMLYAKDVGAWGNRVKVLVQNPATPEFSGHFNIVVYLDSLLVENWKVSRQNIRDGYGRAVYLETVLKGSDYISAVDNLAYTPDVMPKFATTPTAYAMTLGNNGTAATEGDIMRGYEEFLDKDTYAVTILMDAGNTTNAIQKDLLAIAETRHDCVAILSAPFDVMTSPVTYITDLLSYKNSILDANSSYGGLYAPFVEIYDKFNDRNLFIDPSAFVAEAINKASELWQPPAGYRRGVLLEALDTQVRFSEGEMSTLYDASINPVRFTSGKGIVIWGQKTLSFPPSARDRMNVRLLLAVIEPAIKTYLDGFLFELNLPDTRNQIVNGIYSYLTDIKARGGVEDFQIICNDTNNTPQDRNNYTLNVDIYIIPAKSIETINEKIIIMPSGVVFQNA